MGEFDITEPTESVQTALSFFGQRNNSPAGIEELEKEKELHKLIKDLANVKVQLEAKDSAYKRVLVKLDHHRKTSDDLSILLRNSDFQKEFYINECLQSKIRINELKSSMNQMAHKLSEIEKAKVKSENALSEEKLKTGDLMRRVSEMNETIMNLKRKALEIEKERAEAVSEKEAAAKAVAEARKQLEIMQDLENQLLNKSAHVVSLQMELKQANDAISEVNRLKENMELQEKELKQLRVLNEIFDKTKSELEKSKEKENDAQVEIALLKFEMHKAISKQFAAYKADENKNEPINLQENEKEMENMKKELDNAVVKIGELRRRAEQAISRADAAEKAKAALEDQMKRSKDIDKEPSSVELITSNSSSVKYDKAAKNNHQPLGKVLNMKL